MPTGFDFLDTTIRTVGNESELSVEFLSERSEESSGIPWSEPGYEGTIDYRIRQLSYSSSTLLHTCPRKYELYKKRAIHVGPPREEDDPTSNTSITFAFGHVIGEAIQKVYEGWSLEKIIFQMFIHWDADLYAVDEKAKKSLFEAIFAVRKFIALREQGFLADYDLVYYQGKPACELSFSIILPDGFRYRGFVDVVLIHRHTGVVVVLECKTTKAKAVNPATYKNSAQAIGYSIVLDAIFPDLSHYEVLYLVYSSTELEYNVFPFTKNYLQRALWIRELLLEVERIKMYEEAEIYPMHGENCFNFFRECEYINSCTLSTEYLTKPPTPEAEDKTDYQIVVSITDLIQAQIDKE